MFAIIVNFSDWLSIKYREFWNCILVILIFTIVIVIYNFGTLYFELILKKDLLLAYALAITSVFYGLLRFFLGDKIYTK